MPAARRTGARSGGRKFSLASLIIMQSKGRQNQPIMKDCFTGGSLRLPELQLITSYDLSSSFTADWYCTKDTAIS